jgi:hypothetical protein
MEALMPTCRPEILSPVFERVLKLPRPNSVLDVGVGFGKWGFLLREYLDVWNTKQSLYDCRTTRIDGLEPFMPYQLGPGAANWWAYDHVYPVTVQDWILGTKPRASAPASGVASFRYDWIFMMDVLEHLGHGQGEEVLRTLRDRCDLLCLSTPIKVRAQGAVMGNELERHVSTWTLEELDDALPGATIHTHGNKRLCWWEL